MFKDFLYRNKLFLKLKYKGKYADINNVKYSTLIFKILQSLEPRIYNPDDFIQNQFEEIYEVLFIMSGKVGIGYRLFNQIFYGRSIGIGQRVGDYDCQVDMVSEFLYKPTC